MSKKWLWALVGVVIGYVVGCMWPLFKKPE